MNTPIHTGICVTGCAYSESMGTAAMARPEDSVSQCSFFSTLWLFHSFCFCILTCLPNHGRRGGGADTLLRTEHPALPFLQHFDSVWQLLSLQKQSSPDKVESIVTDL